MQPTLDEQQSIDRLERHVADTVAVMDPAPRLEIQSSLTQPCDSPDDGGPQGRIVVSVRYLLRDLPAERHDAVFDAVAARWSSAEWTVLENFSDRDELPTIYVQNNRDGFQVRLLESVDGVLSVGVNSPCVWPNGTPEPES
ncbi:MAG: hypothetical protein ACRDRZ_09845 [Pseudonocardiaceae bacterium]